MRIQTTCGGVMRSCRSDGRTARYRRTRSQQPCCCSRPSNKRLRAADDFGECWSSNSSSSSVVWWWARKESAIRFFLVRVILGIGDIGGSKHELTQRTVLLDKLNVGNQAEPLVPVTVRYEARIYNAELWVLINHVTLECNIPYLEHGIITRNRLEWDGGRSVFIVGNRRLFIISSNSLGCFQVLVRCCGDGHRVLLLGRVYRDWHRKHALGRGKNAGGHRRDIHFGKKGLVRETKIFSRTLRNLPEKEGVFVKILTFLWLFSQKISRC